VFTDICCHLQDSALLAVYAIQFVLDGVAPFGEISFYVILDCSDVRKSELNDHAWSFSASFHMYLVRLVRVFLKCSIVLHFSSISSSLFAIADRTSLRMMTCFSPLFSSFAVSVFRGFATVGISSLGGFGGFVCDRELAWDEALALAWVLYVLSVPGGHVPFLAALALGLDILFCVVFLCVGYRGF
jgi:hypothetical protein